MKIATYNVNSVRKRLPIILDWLSDHQPDVMCLQETKVMDADFPHEAIRKAGYHASFRGMKAYNGVATLTKTAPDLVIHGLHEGADNEDFRIIQTVVSGIPIINTYVPQGYSISSDKYALNVLHAELLRFFTDCDHRHTLRRGGIKRHNTHGLPPQLRIGLLRDAREEPVKVQIQDFELVRAAHGNKVAQAWCNPKYRNGPWSRTSLPRDVAVHARDIQPTVEALHAMAALSGISLL